MSLQRMPMLATHARIVASSSIDHDLRLMANVFEWPLAREHASASACISRDAASAAAAAAWLAVSLPSVWWRAVRPPAASAAAAAAFAAAAASWARPRMRGVWSIGAGDVRKIRLARLLPRLLPPILAATAAD